MQTLTKVYERHDVARQVVIELETAGFPDSSISLLANKAISDQYTDVDDASGAGTGAGVGATVGGAAGLLAGLGLLAIPGLGPVVAAGWLASTVVGAVAGGVTVGWSVHSLMREFQKTMHMSIRRRYAVAEHLSR